MNIARPHNKEKPSGPIKRKFTGTDNPRQLRVIAALLRRPISRQELDSVAGCANGPALISDLRDLGLTVGCERIKSIDRDGCICRPGVYSFTAGDRRRLYQWRAESKKGGPNGTL